MSDRADVNYYEHHLGDYMRDAAHLTMIEEGAYRRMLDAYYVREAPLPLDEKACQKLMRATTKAERAAVSYILKTFFERRQDGYHQGRADREIERFKSRSESAKASANARWTQSGRNANGHANGMRTHSEGNALQSPVSSNQSPIPTHSESRGHAPPAKSCVGDWIPLKTADELEAEEAARAGH